jgi:cell division protein FtsB
VEFAAALFQGEKSRAASAIAAPMATPIASPQAIAAPAPRTAEERAPAREPDVPRRRFHWGLALAATAIIAAAAYLGFDNWRLRRQIHDAQAQHAALGEREQQLQKDLEAQRLANTESAKEIERLRQSQTNIEQLKTVFLFLPPPTRGAARPPSIILPAGTDLAVLTLALEAEDFPQYRATLKDSTANRAVWTSADLHPAVWGDKKMVSISFPAGLLKDQNYVVELTGVPARGAPQAIADYAFRAVLK